MSNKTANHCYEYPDIACDLGDRYPYCDMTCPMNKYGERGFAGYSVIQKVSELQKNGPQAQHKDGECVGMYHNVPEE